MSPSFRDARMSITGVYATAFCPINLKANLADYAPARWGGTLFAEPSPRGEVCLKMWRNQ